MIARSIARAFPLCAQLQWLLLTAIASYLSLASNPGDVFVSVWDKLLHVVCWFVLTLSLRVAWLRRSRFLIAAFALFAYSALIEILQGLNPARQFSLEDIVANGVGVLLGIAAAFLLQPFYLRFLALPVFQNAKIH